MAKLINASKRQLIPRWHTSRKMEFEQPIIPPELLQENKVDPSLFRIEEKKIIWDKDSSISSAIDLFMSLNLANLQQDLYFEKTKSYLISKQGEVSDAVTNIVTPKLRKLDVSNNYTTNKDRIYEILGTLKRFVRDCPHDSLSWNDLAFYYTIIGEKTKAERCMSVAFRLQSFHPFLARSYARFLIHYDQPDKAAYILKKTGMVKTHPEILSADLAVRTSFDVGKPDVKAARRLIKKYTNQPYIISELSASLGTLEVENGSVKKAMEHLKISALVPTENTVAQLKWMSQQHKIIIPVSRNAIHSLEAEAISYYNNKDYASCRDKLMNLHRFQPFSEGALVDAGYLSMVALDDPGFICGATEYFGADVLESFMAKNNYIIAKLLLDELDGVEDMIRDLSNLANDDREKAVLSAAIGMYMYRIGEIDSGRECYNTTNAFFKSRKQYYNLGLSLLHQGMIEKHYDINNAQIIFEQAKKEAKKAALKSPELLEKVLREFKSINQGPQDASKDA